MSEQQYDFFVIGAGSGGVRAARIAAKLGAKVAICEAKLFGGTCVNVGCVPKKLLMYGSQYSQHFQDAEGYGWDVPKASLNWQRLITNKNQEISRLNGIYERILRNAGVDIVVGHGEILDGHRVRVGDTIYSSKTILIATGGKPFVPNISGAEYGITSDQVFFMPELPQRAVIVGAGYIALEFASILCDFGAKVTVIHRREAVLNAGFDDDIRDFLAKELVAKGIELQLSQQIEKVDKQPDESLLIHTQDGQTIAADMLLWATGRKPNVTGLGLENVAVQLGPRGEIVVDDDFRTHCPSIYACGDVIDRVALTPVALAEGMAIARNLFGDQQNQVGYQNIPTAIFTHPNVGTVGLTEQQARAAGYDITIYRSSFRAMKHTLSGRQLRTLMKLIVDKNSDKVLGCHMVGEDAGEIIQGLAVALQAGATKAIFDATIGIHPTAAEEFVTMRTPVS